MTRGSRGQTAVEFILVVCVLLAASYGVSRLFSAAWAGKFNLLKHTRAGAAGIGP